jgi:hypothetical protein
VRDQDQVDVIEAAGEEEGEAVANDVAGVGLQVRVSRGGVDPGRSPHLHRQDAEAPQEGAGIMNGKDRRHEAPALLVDAHDLPAPGDLEIDLHAFGKGHVEPS